MPRQTANAPFHITFPIWIIIDGDIRQEGPPLRSIFRRDNDEVLPVFTYITQAVAYAEYLGQGRFFPYPIDSAQQLIATLKACHEHHSKRIFFDIQPPTPDPERREIATVQLHEFIAFIERISRVPPDAKQ